MSVHASRRVTEEPSPLTSDIDVADLVGMVRMMAANDGLMFSGYAGLPGLYDAPVVASILRVVELMVQALRHPQGRIIFSGCGTSGRLSHLEARAFNRAAVGMGAGKDRFAYLLAGGDAALLLPQEAAEDKPDLGESDLAKWIAASGLSADAPVVVVGISCGLSATYVGSMLSAALNKHAFSAVAVGFNPVKAVKSVKVPGWSRTFYDVLGDMQRGPHAHRAVVLNPVLGPETIAGSSRMKGGSATKILIETCCTLALQRVYGSSGAGLMLTSVPPASVSMGAAAHDSGSAASSTCNAAAIAVHHCLAQYEEVARQTYTQAVSVLVPLIQRTADSLNTLVVPPAATTTVADRSSSTTSTGFVSATGRGRLLYLGVGAAGLLGLIDASECNPTYGSLFNDVRGFIAGGWKTVQTQSGPIDPSTMLVPRHLRGDAGTPTAEKPEPVGIDLESFQRDIVPTLTPADYVLLLAIEGDDTDAGPHPISGASSPAAPIAAPLLQALTVLQQCASAGAQVGHVLVLQRTAYHATASTLTSAAGTRLQSAVCAVAPIGATILAPQLQLSPFPVAGYGSSTSTASATFTPRGCGELALKLCLNAITTCAHVARGTIYGNRMIAVQLTNAKLWHRAVDIVAKVVGCEAVLAERCLLRAVYRLEESSEERISQLLQQSVLTHVSAASSQRGLVPIAILLAAASKANSAGVQTAAAAPVAAAAEVLPAVAEAAAAESVPAVAEATETSSNVIEAPASATDATVVIDEQPAASDVERSQPTATAAAVQAPPAPRGLTVAAAQELLRHQPVIRKAIAAALQQ